MAVDRGVSLNPGGGGATVKTIEVVILNGDGSYSTVEMQAVAVLDREGRTLTITELSTADYQRRQLTLLERIAKACETLANIPTLEDETWPVQQ